MGIGDVKWNVGVGVVWVRVQLEGVPGKYLLHLLTACLAVFSSV